MYLKNSFRPSSSWPCGPDWELLPFELTEYARLYKLQDEMHVAAQVENEERQQTRPRRFSCLLDNGQRYPPAVLAPSPRAEAPKLKCADTSLHTRTVRAAAQIRPSSLSTSGGCPRAVLCQT